MDNKYHKLMEQQCLSQQAKETFYRNLQGTNKSKPRPLLLKAAVIAACLVLMIPVTAYAVENIFGISIVEIVTGTSSRGKIGTGYKISYQEVGSRPLSDFAKEIQTFNGNETVTYNSWKEAESDLGITLVDNTILSDSNIVKEYAYDLKKIGIGNHVHCFTDYESKDNQFYRATITAAYRYDDMHVTLRSTVICEHPSISSEDEYRLHWSGVLFENYDVAEILQEQYVAANGINATVITVDRTNNLSSHYEAVFAANGASYRITIKAYGQGRDAEAKENLIKILEGFSF